MGGTSGSSLHADCTSCFGLCCVAPAFSASADFAIDKPAGHPCPNLTAEFRCGIHAVLRPSGFKGCDVYDCFGAGQKVSQLTFSGRDWRRFPGTARRMFDVFSVMRQLHQLLWYLTEAVRLRAAFSLHSELEEALAETERLTGRGADELLALDLAAHNRRVDSLLANASALVRGDRRGRSRDYSRADLAGADLKKADLRAASLKGTILVGADLRGADMRAADMLGADLRDAQVGGANLSTAIFLTQPQLTSAIGDADTRLPKSLARPRHWRPQR